MNAASMPDSMYRALYERSLDAVFLTAPDGSIFAANPAACDMFRLTEAQICRLGRAGIVDEVDDAFQTYQAERTRNGKARGVLTFIRGDGSRFMGEVSSAQFTDDAGELRAALIIRDFTEREQMEEALHDSEQRYRTIFENSPLGLFRSTVEGRFIEVNPALANILGYDTPEALVYEIHDIGKQLYIDEAERQRVVSRQLQAVEDTSHHFNRYRRRDGRECIANLYLKTIRDEEGRPVFFDGIIEDVTESKRAEDELRASEARFRTFVDHVSDALFLHGEDGMILDANRQACLNLGYRRDELIGMGPAQFDADLSPDSRGAVLERLNKGEIVTFESHHRRKDGSTFPVEVSIRPFMDGDRRVLVSSARDISERLRVEGDLRRLNRELQAKTKELDSSNHQLRRLTAHREEIREQERMNIARNVHDELGQLLTALQMKLSTLALGFGKDNKRLTQEIKSAQDLTDQSLKAARNVISVLRPSSLDMGLAVSLEWLAQQYAASTGIPCDVRLIDWRDELVNEATLIALYRIAQESLTNIARHACADQATIILSGLDDASQLIVRDNGIGFDPELIKEDSFGLIGIRERVAMLGGAFALETKKGKGSELRVTIPVSMQQEAL